jgi:hypothetical protein
VLIRQFLDHNAPGYAVPYRNPLRAGFNQNRASTFVPDLPNHPSDFDANIPNVL